jgi:hypothetical protein
MHGGHPGAGAAAASSTSPLCGGGHLPHEIQCVASFFFKSFLKHFSKVLFIMFFKTFRS